MSVFVPNVRAIRGLAPTALDFNALANNLEYINAKRIPRTCVLRLAGNATFTISATTGFSSVTFDTSLLDTESMFSGGVITLPSDSKFVRMIANITFSTLADRDFGVYPAIYSHELSNSGIILMEHALQMDKNPSIAWNGVKSVNVDTGWMPYNPSVVNYEQLTIGGPTSTTWTINSTTSTWLSVEVL